jgi:RimJ/RimL family protein N-acetyltransferase
MKKHRTIYRFTTRQGLEVRVYRLHADDAESLVDLFDHLSATSRYLRFNEFLDHPDVEYVHQEAQALAQVDDKRGGAWIAVADLPGEPNATIAGARFVRTPVPGVAEVSVAVRDDLHGQGIGSELLVFIARRAKADGIHKLAASFHTSNRAIWALLASAPFQVATEVHGPQTDVLVDLDGVVVDETRETVLA